MSQTRDWRVILKELEAGKVPQNDSLELGDSWRALPRRTEGAANKTSGLYRRSELPEQPAKNIYNFIIDKKPGAGRKKADPAPVDEGPVAQPPKSLIPSVRPITQLPITPENGDSAIDSLNFSEFLTAQNVNALTSTPYPLRQIDANKSPKRTANVQVKVADSPKKLFVPAPTRIPISTPRTSRQKSDAEQPAKQHSNIKRKLSPNPEVSSTVHNISDDNESEPATSPDEQIDVRSNEILSAAENVNRNCPPLDEDQQDAGTKNSDEELFIRPTDVVRRTVAKQTVGDQEDHQSKNSNSSNNAQRNKKSKPKINPLLQSYMKVGESINNRTSSIPLESSSATRRRLYKKGDSCTEEDIVKEIEPLGQPSFVLNPVSAGDNGTFTKAKSIPVQSNAAESDPESGSDAKVDTAIQGPEATAEPQPHADLGKKLPLSQTKQHNIVNLTFDSEEDDQSAVSDSGQEFKNDVQSESASSNENQDDDDDGREKDLPKPNSTDQLDHMSAKHSSKQVLDKILEDWSDTLKSPNDKEESDHSGSIDSEEIHPPTIEQPSTESNVRQVRSQNKRNRHTGTSSSKTDLIGKVRSDLQQIDKAESEDDELSTTSAILRKQSKNASDAKRGNKKTKEEVSKKSKIEPVVRPTQQESESDSDEPIVEERSSRNAKLSRAKKPQQKDVAQSKIPPQPNKPRSKSKTKASKKPGGGIKETDPIITSKDREKETPDQDGAKVQNKQTSTKRFNVESGTELATRSKGKKNNGAADVIETENKTTRAMAEGNVAEAIEEETDLGAKSKRRKYQKRPIAEDDITEEGGPETQLATTSKLKRNNGTVDVIEANGMETEKKTTRAMVEGNVAEAVEEETELGAKSKRRKYQKRPIAEDDMTEEGGPETQLATTSKGKEKKKRSNDDDNVMMETDGNENIGIEVELPPKTKTKASKKRLLVDGNEPGADIQETDPITTFKGREKETSDQHGAVLSKPQRRGRNKRLDADEDAVDEREEPQSEFGDIPDDSNNEVQTTVKSKVRKTQKRKHQSTADARTLSNEQSEVDGSMAKKRKKVVSKWERMPRGLSYDSLKPRENASGVRHSTRERRLPTNNLMFLIPNAKSTSNRSALRRQNGSVRRTQLGNATSSENVFSMLLNGSMDKEPPLITHLEGIEITQGFHKTVKNNLVIHHIPGETGPSYGYFTLEPGMVKRSCRISWNLHIHVVSGPITIVTNAKSEQMVTGSFASLPSGTKYSLRNDGENSALVFFSQRGDT